MLLLALASCTMIQGKSSPTTSPPPPSGGGDTGDGQLTTPNLVGMTLEEATAAVAKAGFKHELETGHDVGCSDDAPKVEGKVMCQSPAAGERTRSYALVNVAVYHNNRRPGILLYEEKEKLKGMTVAQAKAYLKGFGWTGEIKVDTQYMGFVQSCKMGTICGYDDHTMPDGQLTVYMNKTTDVALPPPD